MKRLTKQEKKFVEIKAETGNGTLAAKQAFGIKNYGSAAVRATRMLKDVKIVSAIEEALPSELLTKVHREGLSAKSFRYSPEGELMQLDDFLTRSKYLDMAYKLKGDYAPEKHEVQGTIESKNETAYDAAARAYRAAAIQRRLLKDSGEEGNTQLP